MRLVVAALAAQYLGFANPQVAAQPASAAALAANEVLFEVNVVGRAQTPADSALVTLTFSATGRTSEQARSAAEAMCQRLAEIARRFGAERTEVGRGPSAVGFISEPPPTVEEPVSFIGNEMVVQDNQRWGHGMLRLRLADPRRLAELRTALEGAGALNINSVYSIADDIGPRRDARSHAMTLARAEANQFAQAQGMRVARLLRFTEATDREGEMMRVFMSQFGGRGTGATSQVETAVAAQVSFALAPQ